jgi:hypothetical protein
MKTSNWLIEKYFRQDKETIVHLGPGPAVGTLFVNMPTLQFWKKERFGSKLKSILTRRWAPKELYLKEAAGEILAVEVFGSPLDYAEELYSNIVWFYHKEWKAEHLTQKDLEKAEAFNAMTLLNRMRLGKEYIPKMRLSLYEKNPNICGLTHMMLVKIPVISFQFFLDIDTRFSFHSIRKGRHPHADDLIAYLYELLGIQQKIAVCFHELLKNLHELDKLGNELVMHNMMIDAGMNVEQTIVYLKSSIEKSVFFLGRIFGENKLDGLKEHGKRLNKLYPLIPEKVKKNYYFELVWNFISSENLTELNNMRSGLLHKKGIAGLQPHAHYDKGNDTTSLKLMFQALHTQHARGTAVLLCILAILTDDLVERDKPEIEPFVLLYETSKHFREQIDEQMKQSTAKEDTKDQEDKNA